VQLDCILENAHAEPLILDDREVARRGFAGWGMHLVLPLWNSRGAAAQRRA
jgi:hypothetical protein